MKQGLLIFVMLFYGVNVIYAQSVEGSVTLKPADLFKKKNKKGKADKDMPYVEDARPDERTTYFFQTVLPQNDTAKMSEFLSTGIDINIRATDGGANTRYYQTILMYAIQHCTIATVEYLLRKGADPNLRVRKFWKTMFSQNPHYEFSMYPLEAAAEKGDIEKMELLTKYGADVNKALHGLKEVAANKGDTEMMNWISKKTGISAIQKNALAVMTTRSYEHDVSTVTPQMVDELVQGGADVNAYAPNGKTALINAIQVGEIKDRYGLVKVLIRNGANVNLPDRVSDGYPGATRYYPVSPLKAAVQNNDLQIVKMLVEAGANLNQTDGSTTPLETAKDDKIKEYLILKGAK